MKNDKIVLVTVILTLLCVVSISSASATTWNVTDQDTTDQIQSIIDNNATDGDTINFATGSYEKISLASSKSLQYIGNGAVVSGNGQNAVFDISSSNGTVISGFEININYLNPNNNVSGIIGSNVVNTVITGNTLYNGVDGISFFMTYENITITYNTIYNMTNGNGDGISIVDHTVDRDMDDYTSSIIAYNNISNTIYGIFIGGNFKGNITGNIVTDADAVAIQFVGKREATNGEVIADVTGNTFNSTRVGLDLETPNFSYFNLDNNVISGDSSTVTLTSDVISSNFIVTNNDFYGAEGDLYAFYEAGIDNWSNNTLNGNIYP